MSDVGLEKLLEAIEREISSSRYSIGYGQLSLKLGQWIK